MLFKTIANHPAISALILAFFDRERQRERERLLRERAATFASQTAAVEQRFTELLNRLTEEQVGASLPTVPAQPPSFLFNHLFPV